MFATPHIIAGAAIGKAVRSPWIALPLAFLSHFALDAVPHLDSHGLFGRPGGVTTSGEVVMAGTDLLAGIALVIWATGKQSGRKWILAAGLAGILVDLVFNCPYWNMWVVDRPGTMFLSAFHRASQNNVAPSQWLLGLGTQTVVLGAALWVVRRRKGLRAESEKMISSARPEVRE